MSTNKTTYDGRSALRNPRLTAAVLKQLGGGEEAREATKDIARHGADGGYHGFTYYKDTLAFYREHAKDIIGLAWEQADELGVDMLEMVAGFRCVKGFGVDLYDISKGLEGKGECADAIQNAMAWFALEEVSRELNPDV